MARETRITTTRAHQVNAGRLGAGADETEVQALKAASSFPLLSPGLGSMQLSSQTRFWERLHLLRGGWLGPPPISFLGAKHRLMSVLSLCVSPSAQVLLMNGEEDRCSLLANVIDGQGKQIWLVFVIQDFSVLKL